jgi:hypothetical protein
MIRGSLAARLAGVGLAIGIASTAGAASASTGPATAPHLARVAPGTPMAPSGRASARKPLGYIVEGAEYTSASGGQTGFAVGCPAGKVPLGGGVVQSSKSLGVTVNSSYPLTGGDNGWGVLVNNTSGVTVPFEVQVICADKPKDYSVVQSAYFENPAGQQTGAIYAACPVGTKVLGGGGFMSNGYATTNINSSWPEERFLYPPTYWWVLTVNNASTDDNFVYAFAVCGKLPNYYLAQGSNFTNPAGAQTFASVTCPATTTVIGGGIYSSSPSTADNIGSTYLAANGWNAYVDNGSAASAIIFPIALCAT